MIWSLSSPLPGGSGRETDNREDPAEDRQRPRVDSSHPYIWVICGRRPYCKRNLAWRVRSGASHVSGLFVRQVPLALM